MYNIDFNTFFYLMHFIFPLYIYICSGSREHMFLAGIWCSAKKPPTSECLTPIVEEIQTLTTDGK